MVDSMINEELEKVLFDAVSGSISPKTIFIVGAPRTGSTILYQLMISSFGLPFFSNITNELYSKTPIIGLAVQHGLSIGIKTENAYGKTVGEFQPSEGSAILSEWFGGGHPSQDKSFEIINGREHHFKQTLATVEHLYSGVPLIIKNPWNCFRISYLAKALPEAKFIWIRRDIVAASVSDLNARISTKESPYAWNSATPSNVNELKKLLPSEQVLENQYEFNEAINASLSELDPSRKMEVWYEDLVLNSQYESDRVSEFLNIDMLKNFSKLNFLSEISDKIPAMELAKMQDYVGRDFRFDRSKYIGNIG